MKNEERSEKHKRNSEVEACLKELELLLGDAGSVKQNEFLQPVHPTIFILGCARSGTTLVNQVLAKRLDCCYPTNFLSRFYYAPYIGALLQKLMFDLDTNGELLNTSGEMQLTSLLGKTKGALSPNEFWYFWKRHFNFGEIQKLDESKIDSASAQEFERGLYSIQGVLNKPLLLKGMIMNWNIPYLAKLVRNSFFIFVEREQTYNAQSLLLSRREFFGDESKWYSFKTEEYGEIKDKDAIEQVVAQVAYTNRAIRHGLQQLDEQRYIHISYRDFCNDPERMINEVADKFGIRKNEGAGVGTLKEGTEVKVENEVWEKILKYSVQYS